MPAATMTELLGFTEAFEFATYDILVAAGIPTVVARSDEIQPDVCAVVLFEPGQATDEMTEAGEYCNYAGGTLSIILQSARDDQAPLTPEAQQMLGSMAAKVRVLFRESLMPFEDALPLYDVYSLRPAGETYGLNERRGLDTLTLRWTLSFTINPDAWPVPEGD